MRITLDIPDTILKQVEEARYRLKNDRIPARTRTIIRLIEIGLKTVLGKKKGGDSL
jgi:flagellin-specific chaperone FliS